VRAPPRSAEVKLPLTCGPGSTSGTPSGTELHPATSARPVAPAARRRNVRRSITA
jgi:hypothetical protein